MKQEHVMKQLHMLEEKDQYKELLEKCLTVFNFIPNQIINNGGVKNTYALASEIENQLKIEAYIGNNTNLNK